MYNVTCYGVMSLFNLTLTLKLAANKHKSELIENKEWTLLLVLHGRITLAVSYQSFKWDLSTMRSPYMTQICCCLTV